MCFLRFEGLPDEAQVIEETEFAEATAKARAAAESPTDADSMLKTLLTQEEARVAEAIAFAEVLVPMLAKRLSALLPAARTPSATSFPAREKKPGHDEKRGIADFIDDMLAQERTGTG
jgi:hypothetical protein